MSREIPLTNSTEKAFVDETDFARVSARCWFLDRGHAYTKVMVPITDPKAAHRSFPLKVRMDRYIFHLTTHNFIRIRHAGNDPLNNCRSVMFKQPTPYAEKTRGMTRYLGVKSKNGYIVAEYRNTKGILLRDQAFPIKSNASQQERLNIEDRAARLYDQWAREEEGYNAKTNFLPESIYIEREINKSGLSG